MSTTIEVQDRKVLVSSGEDNSSGPGATIRFTEVRPKKAPSSKQRRRPKGNGGTQDASRWTTAKRASTQEEQPAAEQPQAQTSRHTGRPSVGRQLQQLQQQQDELRHEHSDVFVDYVSELKEFDPTGAHILLWPVQEQFDFFTKKKQTKLSVGNTLGLIRHKLSEASEYLPIYAPIMRAKRLDAQKRYEQGVAALEQRLQQMLVDVEETGQQKEFRNWLKSSNTVAYYAFSQTVEDSLRHRESERGVPRDKALNSLSRALDQLAQELEGFSKWTRSLRERWDRIHEESPWVVKSLQGVTRQAFESPFEEATKRWSYSDIKRTLDVAELYIERSSQPFVQPSGKPKSKKKGSKAKMHSTAGPKGQSGSATSNAKGETGGNTRNARRRHRRLNGGK